MQTICLYLHIHQPYRYRKYTFFDIGNSHDYWNEPDYDAKMNNERVFKKVANKSYRKMLDLLKKNIEIYPNFRVSLSITGTWLEQAEKWAPDLIETLKDLIKTNQVEIIGETYYHSLAFFYNLDEFNLQVRMHEKKIKELFGVTPKVFRNTELSFNNELAKWAEIGGYKGILAEGWNKVLEWRSPNFVYRPVGCSSIKLLTKNYRLSDDIAFRFGDKTWSEWPLTADKYIKWLNMSCQNGNLINLFMDFETFGEHQWHDTGIFEFMDEFISKWLSVRDNNFMTASEVCDTFDASGELSMKDTVTWADTERDLSAWIGNSMQNNIIPRLYSLREKIYGSKNESLINDFRRLTTSDHAYYLCTKYWKDGDVHAYFSAYNSPFEAYLYFCNIIKDIEHRLGITPDEI